MYASWVIVFALLVQFEQAGFAETFDNPAPGDWKLLTGGDGKAMIRGGRLVLDLSAPHEGKWAYAELQRAITLPARIEWDQCLAHDSQYTWFCGALVWSLPSGARESVQAGLGGSGLKGAVFLGDRREAEGTVRPGRWYRLRLELDSSRQVLQVMPVEGNGPTVTLRTRRGLVHGPFFLRFFQNDHRLGPNFPDAYDQDRGVTQIDNVRIAAAKLEARSPPPPGTTYPYKIPVVFNRATRWVTRRDGLSGGCIAYEAVGWMALTGERAVSRWLRLARWVPAKVPRWPLQPEIEDAGAETTVFRLPVGQSEATFVLRALQWNIEQHPICQWRARPRGVRWRIELTATDGVHPFLWKLWSGEMSAEPASGKLDLLSLYRQSGRPNQYAEVDFLVHLQAQGEQHEGARELELRLGLEPRAVVIPRSPVVQVAEVARKRGVVLEAVVVDERGELAGQEVEVSADVAGRRLKMRRPQGSKVFRVVLHGLGPGKYRAGLAARDGRGNVVARGWARIDVTRVEFVNHYERAKRSYCTVSGRALGPLLGDLFAWVPCVALGRSDARAVLGLEDCRQVAAAGKQVKYTKWRVLPRREIRRYLAYMAASGVRVVRITPNVSVAEYYMDAGGHVAMHGLEQLSHILEAARDNGIRCVINLFHYPYLWPGTGNNPPVAQYFEAGYRTRFGWTSDEMWQLLSSYLDELLGFTGEDPAVIAYTPMGENDQHLPAAWINRVYRFVKDRAPEQMVVLEQGGSILHCRDADPASYAEYLPARDGGVGFRTYNTYRYPTDCYIAVAARFFDLAPPSFLGEVSCGINLWPQFIVKLRDAMGLALVLQQPMAISWSAPPLEGTRLAFTKAASMVDWNVFRRARPRVAIIIDRPDADQVRTMARYEAALASVPVDYDHVRPGADRSGYALFFDARDDSVEPRVRRDLPADLIEKLPIRVSAGNHCTYAVSEDRRWMVAYVRNAKRYETLPCDVGRVVELCRMADRPRELEVEVRGFASGSECVVLDAATAREIERRSFGGRTALNLGLTGSDLVVVVRPAGAQPK